MTHRSDVSWIAVATAALLVATLGVAGRAAAPDTRLAQAVKKNDAATVRALIRARVDVNGAEGDGSTPLLWAAFNENLEIARTLIAAGAKANVANRYGVTPLLQASRSGNTTLVETLLRAGADAAVRHPLGETPLMAASAAGYVETVRLLLARGIDVNAREEAQGQTALMWAAGEGHADVVKALLEAGANPNVVAEPTALAARRHADHPSGGLTALMFAAREGHLETARLLAESRADLNVSNPDGATALMIAIINARYDLADMLVDRGANVNDGSLYQVVAMHNATKDMVLNDPTRPRIEHTNVVTTLQLMEKMLAKGADPNKLFNGQLHVVGNCCAPRLTGTPFYHAAERADVEALKLMLAKGGNPNPASDAPAPADPAAGGGGGPAGGGAQGLTPLMAAMNGGAGARGGGPGDNRTGGPNYRETSNRTPIDAVRVLLDGGADVNAARPNGDTALHTAAQSGNVEMIKIFAEHGAKLDVKNKAGLTPLDYASGKAPAPAGRAGGPAARAPAPQPKAIALLRELMNLPAIDEPVAQSPAPAASEGSN